jgi:hypothetical protein
MLNILPLVGTLHLYFSALFYLQKDTSPSLTMFNKNVHEYEYDDMLKMNTL